MQLQQEADKGNIIPLRQYQRALKGSKKQGRNYTLNKLEGTKTKAPLERHQRWAEWVGQQFNVPTEREIPKHVYSTANLGKHNARKHKAGHTTHTRRTSTNTTKLQTPDPNARTPKYRTMANQAV